MSIIEDECDSNCLKELERVNLYCKENLIKALFGWDDRMWVDGKGKGNKGGKWGF